MALGLESSRQKYVLLLCVDHPGYCWHFSFASFNAGNAAHAKVDWCAAFGVHRELISDIPTHSRNETVRLVTKALLTPHRFMLTDRTWSNGAVERLGHEVLRAARALLSELEPRPNQWPDLIPLFLSVINQSPSSQRGNFAPMTAFTGLSPIPAISTFKGSDSARYVTALEVVAQPTVNVQEIQARMDALHRVVKKTLSNSRERSPAVVARGELANFTEGDYVLVARNDFHKKEKLYVLWRDPRCFTTEFNDYVYQVEDLRTESLSEDHATRLKFSDASLDAFVLLPHVLQSETGMQAQRLLHLVETDSGFM